MCGAGEGLWAVCGGGEGLGEGQGLWGRGGVRREGQALGEGAELASLKGRVCKVGWGQEGLHPKKAAGQQWGEAASRGSRGPRGAGYWGPLKARLLGPQALGGLLRHHFTEGKGPGLDTLVKQSMSSRVPDSRPSLDLSLRPSLQQDGAVTVSSPSPPHTGAGPEQKGRRQPPPPGPSHCPPPPRQNGASPLARAAARGPGRSPLLTGVSSEALGNTSAQTRASRTVGEPGRPPHGQRSQP